VLRAILQARSTHWPRHCRQNGGWKVQHRPQRPAGALDGCGCPQHVAGACISSFVRLQHQPCVFEYEPDSDLCDTEQVPLFEDEGIEPFIGREVLPHVPAAWLDESQTQIGYEMSFTHHFYKPPQLRTLDDIKADLLALQEEGEGLLSEIIGGKAP